MGGVPSVPKDPNRTLQVIGAGYSRTGTSSMALALEKLLDGPVCHGGSQMLGREDSMSLEEIPPKWPSISNSCKATSRNGSRCTNNEMQVTDLPC